METRELGQNVLLRLICPCGWKMKRITARGHVSGVSGFFTICPRCWQNKMEIVEFWCDTGKLRTMSATVHGVPRGGGPA